MTFVKKMIVSMTTEFILVTNVALKIITNVVLKRYV